MSVFTHWLILGCDDFSKRLQKGRNREVECLDMVYDKVQSTAALALLLEIPNALLQELSIFFPSSKLRQWSTIVDKLAWENDKQTI